MNADIDDNLAKLEAGGKSSPAVCDSCSPAACDSCTVAGSCTYKTVYADDAENAEDRDSVK